MLYPIRVVTNRAMTDNYLIIFKILYQSPVFMLTDITLAMVIPFEQVKFLRIIVPRFEVDWIKTQGEIAHHKPPTCTSLTRHRLTHRRLGAKGSYLTLVRVADRIL